MPKKHRAWMWMMVLAVMAIADASLVSAGWSCSSLYDSRCSEFGLPYCGGNAVCSYYLYTGGKPKCVLNTVACGSGMVCANARCDLPGYSQAHCEAAGKIWIVPGNICCGITGSEICDNLDNDCNGQTDEGCDDDNDNYCDSTMTRSGTPSTCTAGGNDCVDTNAAIKPGAAEICDGNDNNCNGQADEGLARSCYTGVAGTQGVGICHAGAQTCNAGTWGICAGEVTPSAETCDGILDQDCDGVVDDGCLCTNGQTGQCGPSTDAGECVYGTQTCAEGAWSECIGAVYAVDEICDNIDNDCDGSTDEGCDDDNDDYCDASMTVVCSAQIIGPLIEIVTICPGICPLGGDDCDDINSNINPSAAETCDGNDNNCNGQADEGFDLQADPANCGSCNNACAAGESCIAGVCTPPQISTECSDSLDNDGDDKTDADDPGCYDAGRYDPLDNDEIDTLPQCSDYFDNDNNGCLDYPTDSGCYGLTDMTEVGGICPARLSDESEKDFTICHGPDSDNDGICDKFDSCWYVANPGQEDADKNCEAIKTDASFWSNGWLKDPKCGDDCGCIVPYDNLEITQDTLLCKGVYGIVDAQEDGIINVKAGGITLDCNGATLISQAECSLPGDANYNGHYDYEDVYFIYNQYWNIYQERTTLFDECGHDFNQDGVLDENDHLGVAEKIQQGTNSIDCTPSSGYVVGDYDGSGIIDNYDFLVIRAILGLGFSVKPECGDLTGDGVVDVTDADEMYDIITQYHPTPEGCTCVSQCPAQGCLPTCVGEPWESICQHKCERGDGNTYPDGDMNYNGIIDYADLDIVQKWFQHTFPYFDLCGDTDGSGVITGTELTYLSRIVVENLPSTCALPGDLNHNNRIEGGDLYLLREMISGSLTGYKDTLCGNVYTADDSRTRRCVNAEGEFYQLTQLCSPELCPEGYSCYMIPKINDNDYQEMLNSIFKMQIGSGIVIDGTGIDGGLNGVTIKNCNIYNYSNGIKVESSQNNIFHHNQLYNLEHDIFFVAGSDGTQVYLNHLYKTGVNFEESECAVASQCNKYCIESPAGSGKYVGNYYGQDVGIIENLMVNGEKVLNKGQHVGHDDCGVVQIDLPMASNLLPEKEVEIKFTRQTSKNAPLMYYLEYMDDSMVWKKIADPIADDGSPFYNYHWSTDFIAQSLDLKVTPYDSFINGTPSVVHFGIERRGNVHGRVYCSESGTEVPVKGAVVCYKDVCSQPTLADGSYTLIGALAGQQMLVASNSSMKSQRKTADIIPQGEIEVDFEWVCPIVIDCNPDCTIKGTESQAYPICDPRCEGVNGCSISKNDYVSCEYASKGSRLEYVDESVTEGNKNKYTICCSGEPQNAELEEEKPKLDVDAENIARTTRIVYYNGKPVKMVVVTWD